MSTRAYIAGMLFLMINAIVFGVGATAVLSISSLNANASFWLPLVVIVSFVVSPFIAWAMAPALRTRMH